MPLPGEISKAIERIEASVPNLYKRHYLGYLDSLRKGDYHNALTCLRKYFDYSIKNKSVSPVQYAALNLAALYTHLGGKEKALSAIQIGMLYARDENDQECLSFLLSFLHQITFNIAEPAGSRAKEKEMLDSLANRTMSQNQFHLAALCELRKAKFKMECGESQSIVFECINEAVQLSIKYDVPKISSSISLAKAAAYHIFGKLRTFSIYLTAY